jgi:hypothetical protein
MTLTKQNLIDLIDRDIGDVEVLSAVQVINQAGRALAMARAWTWTNRASVLLDLTATEAFIDLPGDLLRIVAIQPVSINERVVFVDRDSFMDFKHAGANPSGYYATLGASIDGTTGVMTERILIYPEPAESASGVIELDYRGGWNAIADGDAGTKAISIPDWMEPLYLEYFRAYYMGLEEDGNGGVTDRLNRIRAGVIFNDAVTVDVNRQPYHSPIPGSSGVRAFSPQHTYPDIDDA